MWTNLPVRRPRAARSDARSAPRRGERTRQRSRIKPARRSSTTRQCPRLRGFFYGLAERALWSNPPVRRPRARESFPPAGRVHSPGCGRSPTAAPPHTYSPSLQRDVGSRPTPLQYRWRFPSRKKPRGERLSWRQTSRPVSAARRPAPPGPALQLRICPDGQPRGAHTPDPQTPICAAGLFSFRG